MSLGGVCGGDPIYVCRVRTSQKFSVGYNSLAITPLVSSGIDRVK